MSSSNHDVLHNITTTTIANPDINNEDESEDENNDDEDE